MSYYEKSRWPQPSQPRRTDEGIKARSKRGDFVENWWAERWIKALEKITDAGRLRRGRSYARSGQVLAVEEKKGEIHAKVQGSRPNPYRITIRLKSLTDRQWEAVIDALADRAIFTAQLLAGEMPREIEEAFSAAGVSLFPGARDELETQCSCPDWANPCKHVAAAHYILGEQFDEDPFLLFRLRGRSQEQLLSALRERRQSMPSAEAEDAGVALAEESAPYEAQSEDAAPLEESLDAFWQLGQSLAQFPTTIREPATRYPVLRRLGQPSFLSEDIVARLGPAYDAMTREALRVAFAATEAGADMDTDIDQDKDDPDKDVGAT
jgi:uncharacterized Zn finger protein